MKYSFLLPAYKSRFLEQSLRSILSQTYTDFNVIVSDDCSPEDIKSIVDKFSDSRVTYRRNEKNIGAEHLVDHWNLLLGLTDAEYVIMASDDDVYSPEYLKELDGLVQKYRNTDVFRPRIQLVGPIENIIEEEGKFSDERLTLSGYCNLFACGKIRPGIQQYIFRRKTLINSGGFVYFPLAWFSDDATVMEMAKNGLAVSNQMLFKMRFSGESITSQKPSDRVMRSKILSAVLYSNYVVEFSAQQEDVPVESLIHRGRNVTLEMLEQLSLFSFAKGMLYIMFLNSNAFPFEWQVKVWKSRIWKIINKCKKN